MATSYGNQNTFLTPDVIAREALLILENNIVSPQLMSTSATSDFTGAKVGDTIRVRRPAFFGVDTFSRNSGAPNTEVIIQDAFENSVNLVIEKHFDVSFEVSSKELALAVDDFNERLLQPAMSALSQKIDQYALTKIANLGGVYTGNAYAAPNSLTAIAGIVEKMNKQNIPMSNRKLLVSPAMQTALYNIEAFTRADFRGGGYVSPVQEATLGKFMGMDVMMSQVLPQHSAGTALTVPLGDLVGAINNVAGYNEGATTIAIDGLANATLNTDDGINVGDTISITYSDGVVRDHVVTTAAAVSGGGAVAALDIFPGLYGVVTSAPGSSGNRPVVVADNAVITLTGGSNAAPTYTMGAAFHPSAFQMVFVPQPNPMGPGTSSSTVNYNGMSLRVLQSYDHVKKRDLISVDCLVGVAAVDGRLGVRVPSTGG